MGPRAIVASLRLYARDGFISREDGDGDVLQQGGVLLIDRGGDVLFYCSNENAGKTAPIAQVCELPTAANQ